MVHFGQAEALLAKRQVVLDLACQSHPGRFVGKRPTPLPLPSALWINRPAEPEPNTEDESHPGFSPCSTPAAWPSVIPTWALAALKSACVCDISQLLTTQ